MKNKYYLIGVVSVTILLILLTLSWQVGQPSPIGHAGLTSDYWTYMDLPDITDRARRKYCKLNNEEWEEYYKEKEKEDREISDNLEKYIKDWYYGKAD